LMTGTIGQALIPLVTGLLLAFVAYGRQQLVPIAARAGSSQ
jgi:hypothetical protein